MATKTKSKSATKSAPRKTQKVELTPQEQYKQAMYERRNELCKLQGIPEH